MVSGYQHVGIGNAESLRWRSRPTGDPNAWFHAAVENMLKDCCLNLEILQYYNE